MNCFKVSQSCIFQALRSVIARWIRSDQLSSLFLNMYISYFPRKYLHHYWERDHFAWELLKEYLMHLYSKSLLFCGRLWLLFEVHELLTHNQITWTSNQCLMILIEVSYSHHDCNRNGRATIGLCYSMKTFCLYQKSPRTLLSFDTMFGTETYKSECEGQYQWG